MHNSLSGHRKGTVKTLEEHIMNSREYWDSRFETNDWAEAKGKEQSQYFAKTAMELLPEWLTRDAAKYEYSVCDLGCAEGDAVPFLKEHFPNSKIVGTDISEKAVEKARSKYEYADFMTADLMHNDNHFSCDIIFCSNVIEHFPVFKETLKKICSFARFYTIIMCPLREDFEVPEHEVIINTDMIPCVMENNYLVYAQSVKGDIRYYGGEQALLIYSKKPEDQKIVNLSNLADRLRSTALNDAEKSWQIMNDELYLERENSRVLSGKLMDSGEQFRRLEAELNQKEYALQAEIEKRNAVENSLQAGQEKYWNLQQSIIESLGQISGAQNQELQAAKDQKNTGMELLELMKQLENKIVECKDDADRYRLQEELNRLEQRKSELEQEISRLDKGYLLDQTHTITERLMHTRAYLIALGLRRFDNQMMKGTSAERKDFLKYLFNKIFHTHFKCRGIRDYDPLLLADRYIQELQALKQCAVSEESVVYAGDGPCIKHTCQVFIFAGVPFYDVGGGQRSSQLAKTFDKMGYEVHYIYAYESSESTKYDLFCPTVTHVYLYSINEEWVMKKLCGDALFIFEAPYAGFLPYLELGKRCRTVTVYEHIDNWETSIGSLLYDKDSFQIFIRESDHLVATSVELVKQLHGYTDKEVAYLPNAVDITVFEPGYVTEKPKDLVKGKDKTLLYFGSLWGEWFDWDLLIRTAEGCPDCSFNIIGDYAPISERLNQFPHNMHFLGLKKQVELPAYLKETDLAILPFKNCEIGRYVSPLKIFEYIAMGKYVLSEPLPDVIGYPNTFCSDDAEEWIRVIHSEVEKEDYSRFISMNNWYERCNRILSLTGKYYLDAGRYRDRISVIVLNHNNDRVIHRCVNSLLLHNSRYRYEVIVVDNNSEDNSVVNLRRNFEDRIKIVHNRKNGCSSGRNLGVANADGELIVFLDSDQWVISDTWLDAGLYILEHRGSVGAVSWGAGWFVSSDCTGPIVDYFENRAITPERLYRNDLSYLATSGFMISKALFDRIGGFDEAYDPTCFEDTDLSFAVNHAGFQTVYCPYMNIMHLPHQTTNSGSKGHKQLLERNGKYFIDKWKEKDPKVYEKAFRQTVT